MSVIILLADGARIDTIARAIEAGRLPALGRLREDGGLHAITSTFPSVTGPAYAPFLMGRYPGSIGLPGLRWFDRARDVCTFPDYSRSYVGYQMRQVDRDIEGSAATIFELVPDSIAALSVITRGLRREKQIAGLTMRSAFRAASTHFRGDVAGWLRVDRDISAEVVRRVREERPPFVFAAFTGVDKMSHARGHESDGVLDALSVIDDTVGELRARTTEGESVNRVWVTSDHGHSRVTAHEDLSGVIEALGLRVLAHPWIFRRRPDVAVMVSGNAMAHLYVHLDRRARPYGDAMSQRFRAMADELLARDSVDLLLMPLADGGCEVRARRGGHALVSASARRYSYLPSDGDPLGIGRELHDVSGAEAHEATVDTEYPDSVVQIAHLAAAPRSGDIMLSASRDWDFRARYEPIPHVSSHGALHREHMLVPLLLDRPPSRAPKRTVDVMPSALEVLGASIPMGLDGASFYGRNPPRAAR
jgi:Type I phosphodiesterase / nucleotide pyrophosphatase